MKTLLKGAEGYVLHVFGIFGICAVLLCGTGCGDSDSPIEPQGPGNKLPVLTISTADSQAVMDTFEAVEFTFHLSEAASEDIPVTYNVSGDALGDPRDCGDPRNARSLRCVTNWEAIIEEGQKEAKISITPIDYGYLNVTLPTNKIAVGAEWPFKVGSPSAASVIIVSSDTPLVTASVEQPIANEKLQTEAQIIFTIEKAISEDLSVGYAIGGSADVGTDYDSLSGSAVIPAGDTFAIVSIVPTDDGVAEQDEIVAIQINESTNYIIGPAAVATVAITDGPSQELLVATVVVDGPTAVYDELSAVSFTFVLSETSEEDIRITYSLIGEEGCIRLAVVPQVTIPAGELTAQASEAPCRYGKFGVRLGSYLDGGPGSYVSGNPNLALVDFVCIDNPLVSASEAELIADEKLGTKGGIRFSINKSLSRDLVVKYSIHGNAEAGIDYKLLPGSVVIQAGETEVIVFIDPINDGIVEPAEHVYLEVEDGPDYIKGFLDVALVEIIDGE